MKKPLLTIATFAAAITLLNADTITWTGGAGTADYATPGNWDLNRAPVETDDVVIDGAAVTVNGNYRIPLSLTLQNGASWAIGGEMQFGNTGVEHPVIYGGTVRGTLVAAQYAGSTLTISDAAIIDTGTSYNGFWQNTGSYLNFVDGDNRAATFTYQTSIAANPFYFFSNPANTPYIRYNDLVIDAATFNTQFDYTDNGDGTTTLYMKSIDGWFLGALTAGDVSDGQVAVSVSATKYSGGNATIYFVQGLRDYGENFASWPAPTSTNVVTATGSVGATLTLEAGYNHIRAFLLYNGDYTASAAVVRRIMAPYADYGVLTNVYEYIGENNALGTAANWAKDKVAPAPEAPTAGTDIRWFGKNANYSGALAITDKDHFDGATLSLSGDCNISANTVFSNSTVNIYTIVVASPVVLSLYGSSLTTTRNDLWLGVWPPETYPEAADKTFINFLSGRRSTYTFTDDDIGISDAASAKSVLVTPGYLKLDGAAISDAEWDTFFSVEVSGAVVSITYDPAVDENKILSVAASNVTDSSATLAASIFSMASGARVVVACDTAAITEANIVAKGETVAVNEGVAMKSVTSLASGCLYNYAFAIVTNNAVAAFKSGAFFTSDFDYVYMNGAWQGSALENLNTSASVLILDAYNNALANLLVANTVVSNAAITSTGTLMGFGTMQVYSSQINNTKLGDDGAICGTYSGSTFMNFVSLSGNGVVYPACSYTFNATEEWTNDVYNLLFNTQERIHLNGAKVDPATYAANFKLTEGPATGNAKTPYNLTVTYWETVLGGGSSSDWSILPGARVKLATDTRIGALTIADASDVKIDLNGHLLTVKELVVGGEKKRGTFTAATLGCLVGEGSLVTGGTGLMVILR